MKFGCVVVDCGFDKGFVDLYYGVEDWYDYKECVEVDKG